MTSTRVPARRHIPAVLIVTLGLAAAAAWWLARSAPTLADDATSHEHAGHSMDDRAMERWVREWYAAHPASPSAVALAGAPADTFFATGLRFDADGNAGTQVDDAHIFAGQSILWRWVDGTHTTTNGTGAGDPGAGLLWDAPLSSVSPQFTRQFDNTGTFPFFCRPHEGFNMRGNVIVAAPADTFLAAGTTFDADANAATPVDTAVVSVGSAVMWRDVSGTHTVTNGTGGGDPGAGTLFDVELSPSAPVFTFVFKTQGTFPFFCRPHEGFNMRGVVVVTAPLSVDAGPQLRGFMTAPSPSPTRAGVSFRFGLLEAGPVRAEVFDAEGRRVAVVARGTYPAGAHFASWDGRAGGGNRAPAGVYYLRLEVPGFTGARRIVVVR